jgi:hypothetical protein
MTQSIITDAFKSNFMLGHTKRTTVPFMPAATQPKWSWSCHRLDCDQHYPIRTADQGVPQPGDVAVVRVESLGYHTKIMTARNEQLRHYKARLAWALLWRSCFVLRNLRS